MESLGLTEIQAEWILELRLRRLTALAYDELVEEKRTLEATIAELNKILGSEQRRRTIVLNELGELVETYGRPRRTRIASADEVPDLDALEAQVVADLPDDPCVVSLTASGLVGREPAGTSKSYSPSRHDVVTSVVTTTLRQPVLALTSAGRLLRINAADIPEVGGRSRGKDGGEVFTADKGETILAVVSVEGDPVVLVTADGMAKRVERSVLAELKPGRPAIKLMGNDRVVAAFPAAEQEELVLITSDAQALRTPLAAVSLQGAAAKGVAGIKLKGKARVVGAGPAPADGDEGSTVYAAITVTDRGTAKVTATSEIPSKGRGTGGVRLTRFKDEQRIDYAWVGPLERTMAVVGQADAATRADTTPQAITMRPTRRDGVSSRTERRILAVGSLRW
jgi:DNA gyrase subunit A